MSLVYALLLAAVGFIVVAEVFAAVRRLSSPPDWRRVGPAWRPALVPVETEDRRHQPLPYVGRDRRVEAASAQDEGRRRLG